MTSMLRRTILAAGALCLCMACGMADANAAVQARVVSSTWLPGGKYALVCEFEGAEYMTLSADPPGAWVTLPDAAVDAPSDVPVNAPVHATAPAPLVARAEIFPESQSYVGGFFVDPISAALRASGLGLLLGDGWPRNARRFNR